MKSSDVEKYEKMLQERLAELNERLHEIEHDLDEPADADSEERATERESDEVLEQLGNAGLTEIRMIEAALKRIGDGTYGTCAKCGEDISRERLDVLPHTPMCKNCA